MSSIKPHLRNRRAPQSAIPHAIPHTLATLTWLVLATLSPGLASAQASAQTSTLAPAPAALEDLRQQIDELRRQYDARIQALESRLQEAQQQAGKANATSQAAARDVPLDPARPASRTGENRFNPAVSVVLSGGYNGLSKDPESWAIKGFIPGGEELGPGGRGFTLSESEITLSANVDHLFYGSLTFAVTPEDTVEVEEGYVQTTALPAGLRLRAGRFFGGLGYLNEQHSHAWDFVDAPLTHQAFLGGQFKQEGVQARWVLPLERYVELGLELGNGNGFPGNERKRNGAGAMLLSAHTGGDFGLSHSWRAGASWLQTRADGREWETEDPSGGDTALLNTFTGRSRLWVLDGVWKWAPNGNARINSFQLQGEYFRRQERGVVAYDTATTNNEDAYRSAQSGWYLQGVYRFLPQWRVGLRHDQLDSGTTDFGSNTSFLGAEAFKPKRTSLMFDWSPSEFSRWRLQLSEDRVRQGEVDHQLFLRYQVNLGAHGAHSF